MYSSQGKCDFSRFFVYVFFVCARASKMGGWMNQRLAIQMFQVTLAAEVEPSGMWSWSKIAIGDWVTPNASLSPRH